MNNFISILNFEFKYRVKQPVVLVYAAIAFLFGLVSMAGNAGAFNQAHTEDTFMANAPIEIWRMANLFIKLSLFIIPAIIGQGIYQDYNTQIHHILFSYPIKKTSYLSAKFLSAFTLIILISILFIIGLIAGAATPWVNKHILAPFDLLAYTSSFFVFILPAILFFSIISFIVVLFSRSIYTGFIAIVVTLILREFSIRLMAGPNPGGVSLLLDPFGELAVKYYTNSWFGIARNNQNIPVYNYILLNRLLWSMFAFALFAVAMYLFNFRELASAIFKKSNHIPKKKAFHSAFVYINLPEVNYSFNFGAHLKKAWLISHKTYLQIIRSGSFITLVAVGMMMTYILLTQANAPFGVKLLPVTWAMLAFPMLFFSLLVNFMTFLYAGVLINRPRAWRMADIIDTTPVPDWVFAFANCLVLTKIQLSLLFLLMLISIGIQISNHYFPIESYHYAVDLLLIHFPGFVIWSIASVSIQTFFSHSWLGLLFLVMAYFGLSEIHLLGIEKFIWRFNQTPQNIFFLYYSDFSGHGHALIPFIIYKLYWILVAVLLVIASMPFWSRGINLTRSQKVNTAYQRFKADYVIPFCFLFFCVLLMGYWIDHHETAGVLVPSETATVKIEEKATRKYQHLLGNIVQPRIVAVTVNMDIFPAKRSFLSEGYYHLVNQSNVKIDTIIIKKALNVNTSVELQQANYSILQDPEAGLSVYKLLSPLHPGDSMQINYRVANIPNTIFHKNSIVEKNGSYITSLIYPAIGFRPHAYAANPLDSSALTNHYRSSDSDFISFKANISTCAGQTAITTGELKSQWTTNGRNHYVYSSSGLTTNDYVFLSGEYCVLKEKWEDTDIVIYHHKNHTYNLTHLANGIKSTLDYCENHYGRYPHRQITIAEFARSTGDYAQSFAGLIPYSELGFVVDARDTVSALNLPFIGASHELAHQWWGMRVIPADVRGSKLITEGMAEYISFKVLEATYGKAKALAFLNKSHTIYWKNSRDDYNESPLVNYNSNDKTYVPYQKGLLALHTLSYYIGESKMDAALRKYIDNVGLQTAPYTTSYEFIDYLEEVTPDTFQYLIDDLFESVVSFENSIQEAKVTPVKAQGFRLNTIINIRKFQKNKDKKERTPVNDYIEIGLYFKKNNKETLEIKRIKVHSSTCHLALVLPEKPFKIVVDPNFLTLDNNRRDNVAHL